MFSCFFAVPPIILENPHLNNVDHVDEVVEGDDDDDGVDEDDDMEPPEPEIENEEGHEDDHQRMTRDYDFYETCDGEEGTNSESGDKDKP